MTKTEVIEFFDGEVGAVAEAVRSTGSAVSQWPEVLSEHMQDRVLGACVRLGKQVPEAWVANNDKSAA